MSAEKFIILVVEDDESIRSSIKEILEIDHFEVICAANGKAALDIMKEITPSLIILDLLMPIMDGWTFYACFKDLYPKLFERLPVIIMTAGHEPSTQKIHFGELLRKPMNIDLLLSTIHGYQKLTCGASC